MEQIKSFQNSFVKTIRSLKYKKYRNRENIFWAEGIRNVFEAIENNWDVDTLVFSTELLRSDLAKSLLKKTTIRKVSVTKAVFERIAMGELPQGLGAVIKLPNEQGVEKAIPEKNGFYVALENPQDRGNVGAVIRSTNAAGGSGVILVGKSVDPYDPETMRTSMGALFSTPIYTCDSIASFISWNRKYKVNLYGTSAKAKQDFRSVEYSRPLTLVFGNERQGLTADLQQELDLTLSIPMIGRASSLNLSAAVAVVNYQAQGWWVTSSAMKS